MPARLNGPLGLALVGLLLLVVFGWYLSYLAARLDRLHHRVESSRAALEAQLARRAGVALEVSRLLGPPDGARLAGSASRTLNGLAKPPPGVQGAPGAAAGPPLPAARRCDVHGVLIEELPVDEISENELTRALHQAFADPGAAAGLRADPASGILLDQLVRAGERVQLARRFHNDAVAHAQRMRRKRIVRWARLAGRAELPQMVEIDDSPPIGLGSDLI